MTITLSDRKYFAGGVNPHDENVFGVLIETFGTQSLILVADIIEGHSVRTSRNDPDQNARMHMLIYNFACSAFLLCMCVTLCRNVRSTLEFLYSGHTTYPNTGILPKYP